jgi:hypothetical protein
MEVASLYVDQRGEGDLFQERADRHPEMKICPTIEKALTRGTSKLAVDGVVAVAEHGVYPLSENGIMTVLDPDVSADARWSHHTGKLLQPSGQQRGTDVSHG